MKRFINVFLLIILFTNSVFATKGIPIIRDTEIENYLKEISNPILKSAELNPNDIKFYIVDDNSINAFVAGGQNIFVHTGTLVSFDTPDAALGIIAHETGHIAAGHLAKFNEQIKDTQSISIGSILLGIGALIAGVPELGQAIIFGSFQMQQQSILNYTRSQEESADDLATKYLNKNKLSSVALLRSMDKFYMNELQYSNEMEYYSTHPLSRNRRQFIENKIKKETFNNDGFNKKYNDRFNFIKAKILAYNRNQGNNIKIDIEKGSDYERYANAIINMNANKINAALIDVNYLINKYKNNPYFYELKGDIYFKNNDVKNALINYEKADSIIKDNTLIKKTISFIIIKYKQKDMYKKAIDNLNYIVQNDSDDNGSLRLLAEAYYNDKNLAMSYLTLARYYANIKDMQKAKNYMDLAKKNTEEESILNRIEDLRLTINKDE